MADQLTRAKSILKDLVAFPSVSEVSNLPIATYVADYLAEHGITAQWDKHLNGTMANVFATIGPETDGGTILCGHMDVVPADPNGWTSDPFTLTERDGKLFGRGSVDMKGFLAMTLAAVPDMVAANLNVPLHIAFTYDEETCSDGAREMVPFLKALPFKPGACIVGEPTKMTPYIGHKGGMELETVFHGRAGHASIPSNGVSAIYFATRFVEYLRQKADALARNPFPGSKFHPPYTTISVGVIDGGEARNIIPDTCRVVWEMRGLPEDDEVAHLADIKAFVETELIPEMQAGDPSATVTWPVDGMYPGMEAIEGSAAQRLVETVWDVGSPQVVSFGTDGCYIQQADIPTIVIGPGDIGTAHLPDEYIEVTDVQTGMDFMNKLIAHHAADT